MNEKEKVLRYAQLVFKQEGLEKRHLTLSADESVELETVRNELGLSHQEIMDRAKKSIVP